MSRVLQIIAWLCFAATGVLVVAGVMRGPAGSTAIDDRVLALNDDSGSDAIDSAPDTDAAAVPTPDPSPVPTPTITPDPTPAPSVGPDDVEALITSLVERADQWSPGVEVGLALVHESRRYAAGAEEPVYSASSAKAMWIAGAAVAGVRVEELAEPIIEYSDNDLTGELLTETGIDTINAFTAALGLESTRLAGWPFAAEPLRASDYDTVGRVNLTTAADLAEFWWLLATDEIEGIDGPALLELFTVAPDANTELLPYGGTLPQRLPAQAAEGTAHKAGWFPPDCCDTADRHIIAGGSVPLASLDPGDVPGRYAVAIWAKNGDEYDLGVSWVSWAACEVHSLLSATPLSCGRAGDPGATDFEP